MAWHFDHHIGRGERADVRQATADEVQLVVHTQGGKVKLCGDTFTVQVWLRAALDAVDELAAEQKSDLRTVRPATGAFGDVDPHGRRIVDHDPGWVP